LAAGGALLLILGHIRNSSTRLEVFQTTLEVFRTTLELLAYSHHTG
jgi:hypothetical protein